MNTRIVIPSMLTLSLCVPLAGCGGSDAGNSHDDLSSLAAEFSELHPSESPTADAAGPSQATAATGSTQVATAPAAQPLRLSLAVGDRFPLIKTVRQTLEQKSERYPAHSVSELELTMSIQVAQVTDEAALLAVHYHRVKYSHVLDRREVAYDSATHQGPLPPDAAPYAGMVNSGFQFWLGRNNQIQELVGYQEFLMNCVQHVPLERRGQLLAEISTRFGDDAVASFVDDSIGILPFNSEYDANAAANVTVGDTWQVHRRLMNPTPVHLNAACRLVELKETTARIQVTEEIVPAETLASSSQSAPQLTVSSGHGSGTCVIDRRTGLPLDVRLERLLMLSVQLPGGETVEQQKMITTTILAFPASVADAANPTPVGHIQQVSGQQPANQTGAIPTTIP